MSWWVYCKQVRQDRLTYWFVAVRRLCCSNSLYAAHGRWRIQCNHTIEIYDWVGVIFWENFSRRDSFLVSWRFGLKQLFTTFDTMRDMCWRCVLLNAAAESDSSVRKAVQIGRFYISYIICVVFKLTWEHL